MILQVGWRLSQVLSVKQNVADDYSTCSLRSEVGKWTVSPRDGIIILLKYKLNWHSSRKPVRKALSPESFFFTATISVFKWRQKMINNNQSLKSNCWFSQRKSTFTQIFACILLFRTAMKKIEGKISMLYKILFIGLLSIYESWSCELSLKTQT